MSDVQVRINTLHVHPIKSCAVVALDEALLTDTGFEFDRVWMLVDAAGCFVTQRELPRLALVQQTLKHSELVVRAPAMLALHLALDAAQARCRVTVWNDEVAAFDMGDLAAQWFSDFLCRPLRLVRFDPEQRRLSSRDWTGDLDAENAFADGFPILVASTASLAEVNRRLALQGDAAVTMARFRPNLVLDGLDAHCEDHLDEIRFVTAAGPIRLKLVKPCSRCSIPDVEPTTGEPGHAVGDVLAAYRADARMNGALTFGMNAVIAEGVGRALRVGMTGAATLHFAD
jgi:uncharacterized protein YcbX